MHKAFANRPQDWIDIETIIVRQGEKLNTGLVLQELTPLVALKEQSEILLRLHRLLS